MAEFTHLHLHTQYCSSTAPSVCTTSEDAASSRHGVGRAHRPRQHVRHGRLLQEGQGRGREAHLRLRDLRLGDDDRRTRPSARTTTSSCWPRTRRATRTSSTSTRWGSSKASTTTRASTRSCSRSTPRGSSACRPASAARWRRRSCARATRRPRSKALEYKSLFEEDYFFLEVQPNGLDEQEQVNDSWKKMAREDRHSASSPPTTATTSSATTAQAHDILMCIQQGKTLA